MDRNSRASLNKAAPHLLEACKSAIQALQSNQIISPDMRQEILEKLSMAVERAERYAFDGKIRFTVTRKTFENIRNRIQAYPKSEAQMTLIKGLKAAKVTKQRIYIALDADIPAMNLLKNILLSALHSPSARAFERIIKQIDREILSKSPLQHLADQGF